MTTRQTNRQPTEAFGAVKCYLHRRDGEQLVTATDAIFAIRSANPELGVGDEHLTDIVAGAAIILNLDVTLDSDTHGEPVFDRWPLAPTHHAPSACCLD